MTESVSSGRHERASTLAHRARSAPAAAIFFFSSRRRHTRCLSDWSSDVCSSDLNAGPADLPGHPSVVGAHCSLDALEIAVGLARSGSASAVVTGPVAKEQLYSIGFQHPGQTEFVAERSEERRVGHGG